MRKIDFSDAAVWYVPDIEGNRDDPEPFAVLLVPLTGAAVQALERVSAAQVVAKPDESEILARVQLIEERTVRDCVLEVVGYAVVDEQTGKRVEPRNGAELVEAIKGGPASERGILRDISNAAHVRSKMTEGAKKNSPLPSASGPAGTNPLNGDVASTRTAGTSGSATATPTPTPTSLGPLILSYDAAHGPSSTTPTGSVSDGGSTGSGFERSPGVAMA